MNKVIFDQYCFDYPDWEQQLIIFFSNKSHFSNWNDFAWECVKEEFELNKEFISKEHTLQDRMRLYSDFQNVEEKEFLDFMLVFNGLKNSIVFKMPSKIFSVMKCSYSEWNYLFYAFESDKEFYSVIWSTSA